MVTSPYKALPYEVHMDIRDQIHELGYNEDNLSIAGVSPLTWQGFKHAPCEDD